MHNSSGGTISIPNIREFLSAGDLADEVSILLGDQPHNLNLEDFCRDAGSINEVEVSNVKIADDSLRQIPKILQRIDAAESNAKPLDTVQSGESDADDQDGEPDDEEDDITIEGTFDIWFEETYYNGCKDLEWRNEFAGSGDFTIVVSESEIRIAVSAQHRIPEHEAQEDEKLGAQIEAYEKQRQLEAEITPPAIDSELSGDGKPKSTDTGESRKLPQNPFEDVL